MGMTLGRRLEMEIWQYFVQRVHNQALIFQTIGRIIPKSKLIIIEDEKMRS
jgi:hypothetical protein